MKALIESFINGNISFAKPKLARKNHKALREAYQDFIACSTEKANAFADFIKGNISFQSYCDCN